MKRYIDKENPRLLTTNPKGFFTVELPDSVEIADEYFTVAGALDTLDADIGDLRYSIGDTPTATETDILTQAYSKLMASLSLGGDNGKVAELEAELAARGTEIRTLKMQNGNLKGQVTRLKGKENDSE